MRKFFTLLLGVAVVMVIGIGAWLYVDPIGKGAVLPFNADRSFLKEHSVDFLEDLQFKDFEKASTYHLAETQAKRNIPDLIRRIFLVRHEVLDIKSFEILDIDQDRQGNRARVKALVYFHTLGTEQMRENKASNDSVEMILYWFKQPDGQWNMELESSLR